MDILTEKKTLRTVLRRKRREIAAEERILLDEGIFRNVTQSPWFSDADTILLYVSCGGEADTVRVIKEALRLGKNVAVPKCGENGAMQFFLIDSMNSLAAGAYGILEPIGTKKSEITDKTICFVPGVAFTANGDRLGQGGGYYDRFMEQYPSVTMIGICYSCMLLPSLPVEAHDRRVDAVVTEKRVEVFHGIQ